MKAVLVVFTILIIFTFKSFCGIVTNSNEKCRNVEDCYDRKLHPDERETSFSSRSMNYLRQYRAEENNEFWLSKAEAYIENQVKQVLNENIAKNVIFFIGDGMSLTTISGARAYIGGEEKKLSFEKFPYTGLVRTYCVDKKTPDSASTSTAYLTGVKANYGTIGVNGRVKRGDCYGMADKTKHTHSIGSWALNSGKDAGFVTTTRVTHASPSGLYAHTADRSWENDAALNSACPKSKGQIQDIAYQLIYGEVGSRLKVILGGGRANFCSKHKLSSCLRSDKKNLTEEWLRVNNQEKRVYVESRDQLLAIDPLKTDRLLGMFQDNHLQYHLEAINKSSAQPTLEEMTRKAIEVLRKNKKGYFLFVEGGKIDIAHHKVYAKLALDETAELSKAVAAARAMTNENDTLIVVSSDHSHTMTLSGYAQRHKDILGVAKISNEDKLPYMTISYANGQAYKKYFNTKKNIRNNPEEVKRDEIKATFPSTLPLNTETHGGEDVAVYASGPLAHLFTGSYEQNALPHLMAYASCIGNGLKVCDKIH